MTEPFLNKKTVTIHAPATAVWQALIDPELIKHYFFGVETSGEWKEGNTIFYKGEWQGKKFESKGKVLQVETQKLLRYSYWSNMSGLPDTPENYHIITYRLTPKKNKTELTLTEENLPTKEMKENSDKIWNMVFENMKKLLEKQVEIQNH